MLVRVGEIARQEVSLTDVLVRATMARIELDGALVVRERAVVLLRDKRLAGSISFGDLARNDGRAR